MPDPDKKPFQLDLAGPLIRGSSSTFLWVFFIFISIATLMVCALGTLGLTSSPLWLAIFLAGALILIAAGIFASRILGWHAALAGIIVCVAIVFLLFGTCAQTRYHF